MGSCIRHTPLNTQRGFPPLFYVNHTTFQYPGKHEAFPSNIRYQCYALLFFFLFLVHLFPSTEGFVKAQAPDRIAVVGGMF